jgi:hypothetical protein
MKIIFRITIIIRGLRIPLIKWLVRIKKLIKVKESRIMIKVKY